MRRSAGGHGREPLHMYPARHHILSRPGTRVAVHGHRGVLVHACHVIADVSVNLQIQIGVEAASDRMRAVRILHADARHTFRNRSSVQEKVQVAKRVAGEIELARRGHRLQIRHV